MYPFRSLPQELIDEIMDYVDANSDVFTLSALSRSCKAYLPWCQKRLFSTIRFEGHEPRHDQGPIDPLKAKILALLAILQRSPHIAAYVRRLELSITTQYNQWVTEEPFIKVMEIISRSGSPIKELGLYAISFPEQFHDLRELEQKFLQPFINPFITSLTISGLLNVPISLLMESVNLQDFTIDHSALEQLVYHPLHPCPRLETLTFDTAMGVLEIVLNAQGDPNMPPIVDLSQLRFVNTKSYLYNLHAIDDIVHVAKDSLEELHIKHNRVMTYLPFDGLITLSEASRLRLIDIDVVFPSCSSNLGDPLADLCDLLQTIPDINSVEEVELYAFIGFYSYRDGPESSLGANWGILDSELLRISSGKSLVFHLHMTQSFDEGWDASSDEGEGGMGIDARCQVTFKKLAQEYFPLVNRSQNVILKLSQSLDLDG